MVSGQPSGAAAWVSIVSSGNRRRRDAVMAPGTMRPLATMRMADMPTGATRTAIHMHMSMAPTATATPR